MFPTKDGRFVFTANKPGASVCYRGGDPLDEGYVPSTGCRLSTIQRLLLPIVSPDAINGRVHLQESLDCIAEVIALAEGIGHIAAAQFDEVGHRSQWTMQKALRLQYC